MLEVRVSHHFPTASLDVDFAVSELGVTALFGRSGSGKTTIVNAIAGLFTPTSGFIRFGDEVLLDTVARIRTPAHRRRFGYVFQEARLFPHLSVRRNLLFAAPRSANQFDETVDMLDLGGLLARYPRHLSGGERQRVAIGRALLSRPRALLLDEPMAGLDQQRKDDVLPYLERLRDHARLPIVYVSHSVEEIARLADHLVLVEGGTVQAHGSVADVLSRLDVFPAAGDLDAGAVLTANVVRHLECDELTEVAVDEARLLVPLLDREPGDAVRLRIRARDVIIAVEKPHGISANNVLKGAIAGLQDSHHADVDVLIECGSAALIARVTRHSANRLRLDVGRKVFAIVKSVNVAGDHMHFVGESS